MYQVSDFVWVVGLICVTTIIVQAIRSYTRLKLPPPPPTRLVKDVAPRTVADIIPPHMKNGDSDFTQDERDMMTKWREIHNDRTGNPGTGNPT